MFNFFFHYLSLILLSLVKSFSHLFMKTLCLKVIVELGNDRDDDHMQYDINRIVKWCETWYMELSP